MRNYTLDNKEERLINYYNFGVLIDKYVTCFAEDLPECEKMRSMIDYQFENLTKAFFKRQFAWFMIMFVIPFLVIIFVDLKGSVLTTALIISLIGQLGMYSFEMMAMRV